MSDDTTDYLANLHDGEWLDRQTFTHKRAAADLLAAKECTPQCMLAYADDQCDCVCDGLYHGVLCDAEVTDERPDSDTVRPVWLIVRSGWYAPVRQGYIFEHFLVARRGKLNRQALCGKSSRSWAALPEGAQGRFRCQECAERAPWIATDAPVD